MVVRILLFLQITDFYDVKGSIYPKNNKRIIRTLHDKVSLFKLFVVLIVTVVIMNLVNTLFFN